MSMLLCLTDCSLLRWHCVPDWQLRQHSLQRARRNQQLATNSRLRQVHYSVIRRRTARHQSCRHRFRL